MSKENTNTRIDMVLHQSFLECMMYYFTVKPIESDTEDEPVIEGDYHYIVKFCDGEDYEYLPSIIQEAFEEYTKPCLIKIFKGEGRKSEWYYIKDERESYIEY